MIPTFNGVSYLEAQLASIYEQTLQPERVLIRDDGSTDGTQELIQKLAKRYGSWIHIVSSDCNLGCSANVNLLLHSSQAPFVALADQDDIWLPHKLEQSFHLMQELEVSYDPFTPLLIHSDLELVDDKAQPLDCTYNNRQRINPYRTDVADLAITNVVTGCTVLCNRALLNTALPIPDDALMHDWWLALVASCFGKIDFLPESTVYYRQHGKNVLGSTGLGIHYWKKRIHTLLSDPSAGVHTLAACKQAYCFEKRYGRSISPVPGLIRQARLYRLLGIIKLFWNHKNIKHGPIRSFLFYTLLVLLPRSKNF